MRWGKYSMIWLITIIGVVILFGIQFRLFVLEKKEQEKKLKIEKTEQKKKLKKESKDSGQSETRGFNVFIAFLKSENLLRAIAEFLVIVLGATIAINCTEIYEKRQRQTQVASLLKLAEQQIEYSYNFNESLLKQYNESKEEVGVLKYNVTSQIDLVELILENNDALITLTPFTISMLKSGINNISNTNKRIEKADNKDKDLALYVSMINTNLNLMKESIKYERDYIEGKSSKDELQAQCEELINSTFTPITEID